MNRREFWHEMTKSLIDTIKEAASPLMEMYAEQIQETVDGLSSNTWVKVPAQPERSLGSAELLLIQQKAIYLYRNKDGTLKAIENRCNRCGRLLTYIADAKKVKCFSCGLDYNLLTEEGSLKLNMVPLKVEGGQLYLRVIDHES